MYGKRSVPVTTESGRTRGVPRDVWKRDSLHGVPWRGVVDTWQPPWSPMERCGGNVATSMESHGEVWWKRGSFHGVPWTAQFWMRDWWCDTTAGNGCSGMHRLTVSRQLATDAVVCTVPHCLDSWQQMQWYASSQRVTTAGVGMPWTLDQVKYLFLSVDD